MAQDCSNSEYLCTNIAIMQLFHQLKQKFPYVPDRIVNECIRKNGHDKGACEWALEKENRAYLLHSYPPGLGSKMSSEEHLEPNDDSQHCCRRTGHPHSHLPAGVNQYHHQQLQQQSRSPSDFDRRLPGRQSLDSLCRRHHVGKSVTFKHYSDESLHHPSVTCDTTTESTSPSTKEEANCDNLNDSALNSIGYREGSNFIVSETTTTWCRDRELPLNRPTCLVDEASSVGGAGDVRLEIASDVANTACRCERTSVSVVSSCSVERGPNSAPVTPSGYQPPLFPPLSLDVTTPRHRTALSVEPSPPYASHLDSPSRSQCPRPFTSVNLTLRPPSSDPQPPIDIRSSAGGGLTYSTCSYDPRRQGYQSRLRISIGPGGQGSVSAARTKTAGGGGSVAVDHPHPSSVTSSSSSCSPSSPQTEFPTVGMNNIETCSSTRFGVAVENLDPATQAVVNEQLNRKLRLEKELEREKQRLKVMQEEVVTMESDLRSRRSKVNKRSKVQELKEEIRRLFEELKYMTAEVDLSLPVQVPLGETSEDFYRNIYRGQEGHLQIGSQTPRAVHNDHNGQDTTVTESGPPSRLDPSNRRSAPIPDTTEAEPVAPSGPSVPLNNASDGPNWTCNMCTFRNHPLLHTCEQCDMPRGVFGKSVDHAGRNTV